MAEEVRAFLRAVKADMARVNSPLAWMHLALNGAFNEYQKWFGRIDWVWDFMYRACDYEQKMLDPSQQARYVRIGELIEQLCPERAAVLDVGCGTAHGLSVWRGLGLGSFEGIDVAEAAIEGARAAHGGDSPDLPVRFETVSMQSYDSQGRQFDVVIFNESLYYVASVEESVLMVTKALEHLREGGHLIISMSETRHADRIWAALDFLGPPRSQGRVAALEGNAWQVAAFEKPRCGVPSA
mmetsp:Transcript_25344/g.78920  ORF Transcript_25344/g.78920 Transcript_25344/m.78920 type:complete len:240 (+) Transcript_25344:74-793(+)